MPVGPEPIIATFVKSTPHLYAVTGRLKHVSRLGYPRSRKRLGRRYLQTADLLPLGWLVAAYSTVVRQHPAIQRGSLPSLAAELDLLRQNREKADFTAFSNVRKLDCNPPLLVDRRHGNRCQFRVSRFLLIENFAEQDVGFLVAQYLCPLAQRSIAGDFVMLNGLRCG